MKSVEKHIVITIPWHNRNSYLKITLATLKEALRGYGSIPILLFRHNSKELIPKIADDARIELNDLDSKNCHHVYMDMMKIAFQRYNIDYVLNIDADACVHPNLIKSVEKMINNVDDIGHLSFFNEDCHPEPTDKKSFQDKADQFFYTDRKHISFFCSLLARKAWDQFVPNIPKDGQEFDFGCADGMLSTFISSKTNLKVYCTHQSYAEHLGFNGTHSGETPDGRCTSSRARRFYS